MDLQPFGQIEIFETDPYMMLLDDDLLQFQPQSQGDFFGDLAMGYGPIPSDNDYGSWADYLDPPAQSTSEDNGT